MERSWIGHMPIFFAGVQGVANPLYSGSAAWKRPLKVIVNPSEPFWTQCAHRWALFRELC